MILVCCLSQTQSGVFSIASLTDLEIQVKNDNDPITKLSNVFEKNKTEDSNTVQSNLEESKEKNPLKKSDISIEYLQKCEKYFKWCCE
jgi:hypothetical protein